MENHERLFKAQMAVLSPRHPGEINRERQRLARVKKRVDCFQKNRQISLSPTPVKKLPPNCNSPKAEIMAEQENQQPATSTAANPTKALTRTERQKQYLEKFYAWKTETKKRTTLKKQLKKKPLADVATDLFVPPSRRSLYQLVDPKSVKASTNATFNCKKPIAICAEQSNPAVANAAAATTVKNKPDAENAKAKTIDNTDSRMPQTAETVATVKPNSADALQLKTDELIKPNPAANAAAVRTKPAANIRTATASVPAAKTKPAAVARINPVPAVAAVRLNQATAARLHAAASRKPANELETKRNPAAVIRAVQKPKAAAPTAAAQLKPTAAKVKSENIKKPSQTSERAFIQRTSFVSKPANLMTQPFENAKVCNNIAKPILSGGAAAKFKPTVAAAAVKRNTNSQLGMRMKAKKALASKQKLVSQVPELKEQLLLVTAESLSPNTPLDVHEVENPFQTQVTSTQYKSGNVSANNLLEACGDLSIISPLAAVNLSAKRQLLAGAVEAKEPKPRKFNFTRYSEANGLIESPTLNMPEQTVLPNSAAAEGTLIDDSMTLLPQTPPPNADCVPNYLSPFVSVTRGKVNSRSEREKRNSMYLQEQDAEQPETPAAVRRTLATVGYFRLQLSKEIARLHLICDTWQNYSTENIEQLELTGGKDMIDAAIGQTKLLTSKKLMQFKSLIDRCEAGATGKGLLPNDGSEATKPVLAEDLEGWWDMISLQSENVEKRFNNLERWKANDWVDPDLQAPTKPKSNQAKPKSKPKPASKPSSNIKSFLRKAYLEKRKKELTEPTTTDDLIQLNGTPKRRSRVIVVRDRKSFSPAKTVLRLSIGGGSRPSISNTLLKSAIKGATEQKIRQQQSTPPATKSRMSILKTPGTVKREQATRGVVFSVKKNVRRFQFTTDEGELSDDENVGHDKLEDCEEDMSLEKSASSSFQQATGEMEATSADRNASRAYTLRNRKIKLRPSSEFM